MSPTPLDGLIITGAPVGISLLKSKLLAELVNLIEEAVKCASTLGLCWAGFGNGIYGWG